MARTQVQSELIATNAISGTIIADGAITSTHLAANCVDSSELVTGSIDTIHIAANQVTSAKIVSDAVLTRHIADNQVTGDQLANGISMTNATTIVTDGAVSTLTLHRDGSNIGTASDIGSIQFAQDYDASKQNWGAISLKTTASAVRTRLAFDVKTTSGLVQEGMTIFGSDSNGPMVGIGNTSPNQLLHIQKASVDNYIRVGPNATGNDAGIYFATNSDWCVGIDNSNSNGFSIASGSTVGTNPRLTIDTSGNVFVGRTSNYWSSRGIFQADQDDRTQLLVKNDDTGSSASSALTLNAAGNSWVWAIGSSNNNSNALTLSVDATSPSEKFRVTTAGNVGIGTTSPAYALHVENSGSIAGLISRSGSGTNSFENAMIIDAKTSNDAADGYGPALYFSLTDSGVTRSEIANISVIRDGADNSGQMQFGVRNAGTWDYDAMVIDKTSNVGIGTSSPDGTSRLTLVHPSGTNGRLISLYRSAGAYGFHLGVDSNSHFNIYDNDGTSSLMSIAHTTGKVGIGDTAPQDYLEINGSGSGLGGLTISNSSHNHAALSFARSSTATARVYITEPDATHTSAMHFQTSDASGSSPNLITAMTIDEGQKVGIGTASPVNDLHLAGAANTAVYLKITNATTGNTANDGSAIGIDADGDLVIHNAEAKEQKFYTSDTLRMTLSSDGDLGIGATPITNSRLTVKTQGDGTYPIRVINSADSDMLFGVYESSDGDGNNGMLYINDGGGTTKVKLSTNGGSYFTGGILAVGGNNPNTGLSNSAASIQILAPTTATADYTSGDFNAGSLLSLDANNGENHYAGIRFTHNGNTEGFFGLVRTTATTDIADFVWQGYDGNNNTYKEYFRIAANGDLTAIDTSIASNSDKRLKENIEDFTGGLELISKLKPRTFTWKKPKQRKEGIIRGFVAQEVLEVDDYWIDEIEVKDKENPEYEYIKDTEKAYTSKLSDKDAMYISAIQELEARIKKLEG